MKLVKPISMLLIACGVGLSTPLVHAELTTTKTDAAAAPLSQAFPSVTFTFDAPYDFASLDLFVDFDGSLMSLNPAAATLSIGNMSGGYYDVLNGLESLPGSTFTYTENNAIGHYSLSAYYLVESLMITPPTVVITGALQFLPNFTAGMSSPVHVYGHFGSAADPLALSSFDVSPMVTVVPEPETWLMLLGGLGLLLTRVRRASARAVAA